jgi:hypothetical protein
VLHCERSALAVQHNKVFIWGQPSRPQTPTEL